MLFDQTGNRKYLTANERREFVAIAGRASSEVETFCLTLAYTGARISEILALTAARIDVGTNSIIIESLKKRRRGIYRAIPVPEELLAQLEAVHHIKSAHADEGRRNLRIWGWSRTTAWHRVKDIMRCAGIGDPRAMPKALRHAFGVEATQVSVPLNILQKWMGHARLTTTAIYADATGDEERALARRTWAGLER